jgi:hypothetical protein
MLKRCTGYLQYEGILALLMMIAAAGRAGWWPRQCLELINESDAKISDRRYAVPSRDERFDLCEKIRIELPAVVEPFLWPFRYYCPFYTGVS